MFIRWQIREAKHLIICGNAVTSFICAAQGGNDVLALLEMMLPLGQMMLCLSAQMKKPESKYFQAFGTDTQNGTGL